MVDACRIELLERSVVARIDATKSCNQLDRILSSDNKSILTHDHTHSQKCINMHISVILSKSIITAISHEHMRYSICKPFLTLQQIFLNFGNSAELGNTWAPITKRMMVESTVSWKCQHQFKQPTAHNEKRCLETYLPAREQGLGSSIPKLPIWNKCLHLVSNKVTFKVALSVNCPSSSPLHHINNYIYVTIAAYMVHHLDQRKRLVHALSFFSRQSASWSSSLAFKKKGPQFSSTKHRLRDLCLNSTKWNKHKTTSIYKIKHIAWGSLEISGEFVEGHGMIFCYHIIAL